MNNLPEILTVNGIATPTAELLKANEGDEETIAAIQSLTPGASIRLGGGASPIVDIACPNEVFHSLSIFLMNGQHGSFLMKIIRGRAKKPLAYFRFSSESHRAQSLERYKQEERERAAWRASRKAEKANITCNLAINDILYYSWGYEQTNVDFFQVVGLTPKGVKIREIENIGVPSAHDGLHSMSGKCVACKDQFTKDSVVISKRLLSPTSVKMSHGTAVKWDGTPRYHSWYA